MDTLTLPSIDPERVGSRTPASLQLTEKLIKKGLSYQILKVGPISVSRKHLHMAKPLYLFGILDMYSKGLGFIRKLRTDFVRRNFSSPNDPQHRQTINTATSMRIADLYAEVEHQPENAEVLRCYQALASETISQFECLIESGLSVEPWRETGEPYASSRKMELDVAENHIYFLPTLRAYGDGVSTLDQSNNPLLSPTKFSFKNYTLLVNDVFRIVHDVFGHAADGNQFGPIGEENAWLSHSIMFTFDARKALTTETRGQNSWFNFGPHLRHTSGELCSATSPGYIPIANRPFAPQKMAILPNWVVEIV